MSYADLSLIAHLPVEGGSEEGADGDGGRGCIENITDADQRRDRAAESEAEEADAVIRAFINELR